MVTQLCHCFLSHILCRCHTGLHHVVFFFFSTIFMWMSVQKLNWGQSTLIYGYVHVHFLHYIDLLRHMTVHCCVYDEKWKHWAEMNFHIVLSFGLWTSVSTSRLPVWIKPREVRCPVGWRKCIRSRWPVPLLFNLPCCLQGAKANPSAAPDSHWQSNNHTLCGVFFGHLEHFLQSNPNMVL